MANFISVSVTNATPHLGGTRLIGLNNMVSIIATGTTTVKVHCGLSDDVTLTTSADGALAVVNAFTSTIAGSPVGNIIPLNLPSGVTITAFTLA